MEGGRGGIFSGSVAVCIGALPIGKPRPCAVDESGDGGGGGPNGLEGARGGPKPPGAVMGGAGMLPIAIVRASPDGG